MSWFKKIGRKKDGGGSSEKAANAADETVFFEAEVEAEPKPTQSRSSMISELAGLDQEVSADLSGELEQQSKANILNSGGSLIGQYAGDDDFESIDLADFDLTDDPKKSSNEASSLRATPTFTNDQLPSLEDDSGQQKTAIFNTGSAQSQESDSGQQKTAIFNTDIAQSQESDSGQQKTAIFAADQIDTEASISLDDPQFAALRAAEPPIAAQPPQNTPPELDFDSHPELDMGSGEFNTPSLSFDDTHGGTDISLIDQLADGFDLDLSADEEPTMEIPSSTFSRAPTPTPTTDFDPTPPATVITTAAESTNTADSVENSVGVIDDDSTSEQSIDFEELATAKLPEPIPLIAPRPEADEPEEPDDFDATVITTAAVAPAIAAGAEYVTGWVVVVDGPGKGQSRPIFSGINPIGRSPDQAIPLYFGGKSDGEVSRRDHTRIVYDPRGNHFKLQHGASRNLTYLNDEPVLEIINLKPYDRIGIGKTTLLFVPMCGDQFRW